MTTNIEVIWEPKPAVLAADFDYMAGALENLQVPLAFAAVAAAEDSARRFAAEGPGWEPWSEQYAIYTQAHSLLWLTGAMHDHATSPGSYMVAGDALVFPFEDEKEMVHQYGGSNWPARPYVGLSPDGEAAVMEGFAGWLDRILGGGGGIGLPPIGGMPGEFFSIGGRAVFRPRSSLGTFLPGGFG